MSAISAWLHSHSYYFLTLQGNSQAALALFAGTILALVLFEAFANRRDIDDARAHIPLVIGGWGTRGKSGTERLKAGLFTGLGYEVFCKTTGCEAMMIHSAPGQEPVEMFLFRPYDKSSIWEQRDMLQLGSRLDAEVMLWECMALNPVYVQILQREWMRDDFSTVTNAYPDHEDIQGPRGINVAEVISTFVPDRARLVTSELSYKPILDQRCEERGTELSWVGRRTGDLIARDLLGLFPYDEHPRNIALVARVAQELGLDRAFAIATMAENVVPDLGVLKTFPEVKVFGRRLTFINGFSANDPTGTIGNWRRTGCDRFAPADDDAAMVTVVNNRADRPARSQVFSRLIVENLAADKHVLIGTNLEGLSGLVRQAVERFTAEMKVILPGELTATGGETAVRERLYRHLASLRIGPPSAERALARLEVYARGCGLSIAPGGRNALLPLIESALEATGEETTEPARVREAIAAALAPVLATALAAPPVTAPSADPAPERATGSAGERTSRTSAFRRDPPECVETPARSEAESHFATFLARMVVGARLLAGARTILTRKDASAIDPFHRRVRAAWSALYLESIEVVDDPDATGDQVIARVARCAPPGTRVRVMGLQNIKGTGLDFVYRWIALDKIARAVSALDSRTPERRLDALKTLELFEDYGLVACTLARAALAPGVPADASREEKDAHERATARIASVYASKVAALGARKVEGSSRDSFLDWLEGWLDWLDAIRRRRIARLITDDLTAHRISHRQASIELRALYYRQKGGWLRSRRR